jgi:hypothetical protein
MFQLLTFEVTSAMKWNTLGQYFYKLYIVVLVIQLVPIFSFILVYVLAPPVSIKLPYWSSPLNLSVVVLAVLLIQFLIFDKKIKSIRKDQGLRLKLEKYFRLTIVRYILLGVVSLLLAYGFYLTKDDRITGLFAITLILFGVLWPRSAKVCSDLKLRGDEREMVYYQKDHF